MTRTATRGSASGWKTGRTLDVHAEKIVGRRGETVRIPLKPRLQGEEFLVDDALDDLEAIRERWTSYPRWVQNALRRKYPVTRSWTPDELESS